jgi:hypothetical protein
MIFILLVKVQLEKETLKAFRIYFYGGYYLISQSIVREGYDKASL